MPLENRTLPSGQEVTLPRGKSPDRYIKLEQEERDKVYRSLKELAGDLSEESRANLEEETWKQIASPKLDYALKKPAEALKGMPVSQAILEAMKQQGLKEGGLSGRTPEQLMYFCLNYLQNAPENRQGEKGVGMNNMDKVGPNEWVEIFKVEGRWKLRVIATDGKTVRMSGFLFPPKPGKETKEEIAEEKTEDGEALTRKEARKERREERRERRKERREKRRAHRKGVEGESEEDSGADIEPGVNSTAVDELINEPEPDLEEGAAVVPESSNGDAKQTEPEEEGEVIVPGSEEQPDATTLTPETSTEETPEPAQPASTDVVVPSPVVETVPKAPAPVVESSPPAEKPHEPVDIGIPLPNHKSILIPMPPEMAAKMEEIRFGPENLERVYRALPGAQKLLRNAHLEMPKSSQITSESVVDYQARAHEFREGLVAREPRLKSLQQFFGTAIPLFRKEINAIDLTQINNKEQLETIVREMGERLGEKIKPFEATFDEKKVEDLMRNGNMEVMLAFFLSAIQEIAIIGAEYVRKDQQNFQRVMNLLVDERVME